MSELLTREACANHPDQLGTALCDHCGKAMCAACVTEALAAPEEYCSRRCADAAQVEVFSKFLAGVDAPFTTGVKLWWRSLTPLFTAIWPVVLLTAIAFWLMPKENEVGNADATITSVLAISLIALAVYGIVVTSAAMSQVHTELIKGNALTWSARRLVPWALTWILMMLAIGVGYILFIIPGIYLALRLFWADEYALAHRAGPWRALKESWKLTKGEVGAIFRSSF